MISQDGEIKELIHEEENVHLSPGWGFGQWQQFCSLTVNTEIAPTDIIRFITREDGADLWLPVTSSKCEVTHCSVKDNVVNVADVSDHVPSIIALYDLARIPSLYPKLRFRPTLIQALSPHRLIVEPNYMSRRRVLTYIKLITIGVISTPSSR